MRDMKTTVAPNPLPEWYEHAACVGHNALFFPEQLGAGRPSEALINQAKAICGQCDVADICLDYALGMTNAQDPYGIWGGTTARERQNMRRRNRTRRAA